MIDMDVHLPLCMYHCLLSIIYSGRIQSKDNQCIGTVVIVVLLNHSYFPFHSITCIANAPPTSTHLNNLSHFLNIYNAVTVHIIHSECPLQLFLRCTARCYINRKQELLQMKTKMGNRRNGGKRENHIDYPGTFIVS